jgi:diacylglycerol kinase (ATP)
MDRLPMRICLYGNPTAGGGTSLDDLAALIAKAGHRVVDVIEDAKEACPLLDPNLDCVVAAGGDGTIARAARALVGGQLPLAMLPVGTANNIARSLGLHGDPEELIARWCPDRIGRMDVGVIDNGSTRSYFLESVGCGLVTECIAEARDTIAKDDPDTHLADARQLYVDTLHHLVPRRYQIQLDDETIEGDFLVVEALNTPSIGPRAEFAAGTNAADGSLSLVVVAEADRRQLAHYLESLRAGDAAPAGFESWRVRAITITGADRIHVDDRVVPVQAARISIGILRSALPVLT